MTTVREWLQSATRQLAEAGVPSPAVDARALLEHALSLSPTGVLLRSDEEVVPQDAARLAAVLERRLARVPLQHLLGEVEWGGLRLRSDARALVPRPETEWLLHLSVQDLSSVPSPRVLDVGTGSGAVALGLKSERPDARVWATDLSPEALALARENAALAGLDVAFVQGSLLAGLDGPFDLIVSNPPYLPESDRLGAEPEVQHDPPLALYAGEDGLALARPLAAQALRALKPGAPLWLELDPRNAAVFADELRASGWKVSVHADLTGRKRFVRASPTRERMPGV